MELQPIIAGLLQGTVMMLYLYPLRLTSTKVVGTDLAHAIPLALAAGAGHLFLGNVDYRLLLACSAAPFRERFSVPGSRPRRRIPCSARF